MCSHVTRISNSTYQNSVHYKFSAPYFALIINNYFVSVLRDLSTEPVECFLVAKVGMDWVALLAQCRDRARKGHWELLKLLRVLPRLES